MRRRIPGIVRTNMNVLATTDSERLESVCDIERVIRWFGQS